jgi:hypothetical protein
MHLGIARLLGILGRGRCIDDRRIDDRAGRNLQPLRRQMPLRLVEQPPAQIMLFEQVAEAAHRRLIRHRLAPEIDPDKTPHRQRIVERLFVDLTGIRIDLLARLVSRVIAYLNPFKCMVRV